MSQSASQAAAFRRDLCSNGGRVWTVEDDGGIPAPETAEGKRSMPFWSSVSRVEKIIDNVDAYSGFRPREMSLAEFEGEILVELEDDGLLVGVNWSGENATGYDVEPADVRGWLEALRESGELSG